MTSPAPITNPKRTNQEREREIKKIPRKIARSLNPNIKIDPMSSKNCSRKTERGEKRGDGGEAVVAATRGGKKGGRFEGRKKLGAVERICARRSHLRSHAMRVSTRGKDRRRRRSTMESNWHPSTATAMRTCQTRRRSRAICRRQT